MVYSVQRQTARTISLKTACVCEIINSFRNSSLCSIRQSKHLQKRHNKHGVRLLFSAYFKSTHCVYFPAILL